LLKARILTALILGAAVLGALFLLPGLWAASTLALLWLAGAWECAAFARFTGAARIAYTGVMFLLVLSAPVWIGQAQVIHALLVFASVWWLVAFAALLLGYRKIPLPLVAFGGLCALLPSWAMLAYLLQMPVVGARFAFAGLVLVWSADIGAFFCGRRFGRVKLAPTVSPGKTWEGVAGGTAAAVLAGMVASFWLPIGLWLYAGIGLMTALISVVGDLTVSLGKRNIGLKDSGSLLPGHGGMLDRIDSLTAALPAYVIGLQLAGVVA
jgi:phosphatidate cytidylyltransferase